MCAYWVRNPDMRVNSKSRNLSSQCPVVKYITVGPFLGAHLGTKIVYEI